MTPLRILFIWYGASGALRKRLKNLNYHVSNIDVNIRIGSPLVHCFRKCKQGGFPHSECNKKTVQTASLRGGFGNIREKRLKTVFCHIKHPTLSCCFHVA